MPEITFPCVGNDWGTVRWRLYPGGRVERLDPDGVWREPPPSEVEWTLDVRLCLQEPVAPQRACACLGCQRKPKHGQCECGENCNCRCKLGPAHNTQAK
jgi:hypothetical protein